MQNHRAMAGVHTGLLTELFSRRIFPLAGDLHLQVSTTPLHMCTKHHGLYEASSATSAPLLCTWDMAYHALRHQLMYAFVISIHSKIYLLPSLLYLTSLASLASSHPHP